MKKSDPEKQKTRPDLGDLEYVVWLSQQPENRGIEVAELYRKMLAWCAKKGAVPTRMRLLKWIEKDREAMPMTYTPPYYSVDETPGSGDAETDEVDTSISLPCEFCGKEYCLMLHREERGL